jgi:hypothetical protein
MLGGRLVGEGDVVADFTVVTISSGSVLLEYGGTEHCLTLWETP